MPKVKARLADVKTEYELISPDTYRLKIEEFKFSTSNGRDSYAVKVVVNDPSNEHNGKPVFHNISMHKKNGEENQAGAADLKRFFEAALGWDENSDWDEADTDDLLKQEFVADVYIEEYEKNGKKGKSNRINSSSMQPV